MKLYFHPFSGSSRRVLLTAAHLDLPLERIVVDLPTGEHRGEAHASRNPNRRVPVLDDNGFLLWESRAIMQYLAEGTALYPGEKRARADVNRWLFWCAAHMSPTNTVFVVENFVKARAGREPDPVELARGEALAKEHYAVLDGHLAGKTWIAQEQLTLADFSIAATFALVGPAKLPVESYGNLRAWLERVQELAAWRQTTPQR